MRFLFLFLFVSLSLINEAHAIIYEVGGNFGYDKQVYGTNRENSVTGRTYSGSLAFYLFQYTALELTYSENDRRTMETRNLAIEGTDFSLVSASNKVKSYYYGIGFRQQLGPKRAFLVPLISIGYAKQFIEGTSEFTYENDNNGMIISQKFEDPRQRIDSVFATFSLKLSLTRTISLNGTIKTVFKAFEIDRARDNMRYTAGLSWIF